MQPNPTPLMQTLAQQRARHAYDVVDRCYGEEFGEQAKKMPMRILASGLGQTLAFLAAKKKAPELRKALTEWCRQRKIVTSPGDDALLDDLRKKDAAFLRRATEESLAWLEWVNRFADARKKDEED